MQARLHRNHSLTVGASNNFENNSNNHCENCQRRTILFLTRALAHLPNLVMPWRITTAHLIARHYATPIETPTRLVSLSVLPNKNDKYCGICARFHRGIRLRRRITAWQKNACLIYAALVAPTIQSGWASALIAALGIRCSDSLKPNQRPACCPSVFTWTLSSQVRRNRLVKFRRRLFPALPVAWRSLTACLAADLFLAALCCLVAIPELEKARFCCKLLRL